MSRMRPLFVVLLACLVPLAGCQARFTQEQLPAVHSQPLTAFPYRTIQIGLCEDYPEEDPRNIEKFRRDMALCRSLGADYVRFSIGWDGVEGRKDEYNWALWDRLIKIAVEEYHVRPIPYVCYTPAWAVKPGTENPQTKAPLKVEEFTEFMRLAAARYKGQVKSWEIWNEPDNPHYWEASAEDFAKLLKAGADGVRQGNAEAQIVLGGIAWNVEFLTTLLRDHGVAPYVDVVNIHNYFETWSPEPIENLTVYVNRVHDVVARYGEREPIWVAEIGYSSYRRGAYVSEVYSAYHDFEHTPEYQGDALFRMMTMLWATGKVALVAWYEIKDLETNEPVIGDVNNRHLGLVGPRYEPKPARAAFEFFTKMFSGPVRSLDQVARVEKGLGSAAMVHAFQRADGRVLIVAWLRTARWGRGDGPGWAAKMLPENERINVILPGGAQGEAILTDEAGRRLGRLPMQEKDRAGADAASLALDLVPGQVAVVVIEPEDAQAWD